MGVIKDIAAIVGLVLSIVSLLTICTRGGRALIRKLITNNTQELQAENKQQFKDINNIKQSVASVIEKLIKMETTLEGITDFSKQSCRDTIKDIYYKYNNKKQIPLYERKTADNAYQLYHERFGGNSYATLLYTEICKWEIDSSKADQFDV